MRVRLFRGYNGADCTLGMLEVPGVSVPLYTLEEPWRGNQRQVSCIPRGIYQCAPHDGTRFKDVWQVLNVINRSAILIHAGNTVADIEGCILVGLEHGVLRNSKAVLRSKPAIDILRKTIGKTRFTLEIL